MWRCTPGRFRSAKDGPVRRSLPVKSQGKGSMDEVEGRKHMAKMDLQLGHAVSVKAEVHVSSGGLVAIGALVSSIILSVAPLVWAARRRPY